MLAIYRRRHAVRDFLSPPLLPPYASAPPGITAAAMPLSASQIRHFAAIFAFRQPPLTAEAGDAMPLYFRAAFAMPIVMLPEDFAFCAFDAALAFMPARAFSFIA